jgi:hypothetical protein
MNPYLEQEDVWHDFHTRLIPVAAAVLAPQLRPDFIVKVDTTVYVHEPPASDRHLLGRPDVFVTTSAASQAVPPRHAQQAVTAAAAETAAPAYGRIPTGIDVEELGFIEIRDRESRSVVTVIELLSPSNKDPNKDLPQYLAKRRQLLASGVHYVEIDLLRGGTRPPVEGLPDCDYYAMVSRAEERPRVALWPLLLRDRLPDIPIPVRAPHADARLDLQAALNRVYDEAGYEDYIYKGAPQPPLHPTIAKWAEAFIPAASR